MSRPSDLARQANEVRRLKLKLGQAPELLHDMIRTASDYSLPKAHIARATGMSRAQIYRILDQDYARRQAR